MATIGRLHLAISFDRSPTQRKSSRKKTMLPPIGQTPPPSSSKLENLKKNKHVKNNVRERKKKSQDPTRSEAEWLKQLVMIARPMPVAVHFDSGHDHHFSEDSRRVISSRLEEIVDVCHARCVCDPCPCYTSIPVRSTINSYRHQNQQRSSDSNILEYTCDHQSRLNAIRWSEPHYRKPPTKYIELHYRFHCFSTDGKPIGSAVLHSSGWGGRFLKNFFVCRFVLILAICGVTGFSNTTHYRL